MIEPKKGRARKSQLIRKLSDAGRRVIEPLENRLLLDGSPFTAVANDFANQLNTIETALNTAPALVNSIPLLKSAPATAALNALQFFNSAALDQIRTALATINDKAGLESALNTVFGAGGLGMNPTIVSDNVDSANSALDFTINLHKSLYSATVSAPFDLGLRIPLTIGGNVDVQMNLVMDEQNLSFHFTNGAVTLDPGTLKVTATAILDPSNNAINATLGNLTASLTPQASPQSRFSGEFDYANSTASLNLTGDLALNLNLVLGAGAQFPSIGAGLHVGWHFSPSGAGTPTAYYDNVTMNLGSFLGNILKPILSDIQQTVRPYQPLFDLLTYPLPGLSTLSNAIGKGDVTLLTIASAAADLSGDPEYQALANVLTIVVKAEETINAVDLSTPNDVVINFGRFDVGTTTSLIGDLPDPNSLTVTGAGGIISSANLVGMIQSAANSPALAGLKNAITNLTSSDELNPQPQGGIGFAVPLLDDPAQGIFRLLLGQQPDLVTFHANLAGKTGGAGLPSIDFYGVHGGFAGSVGVDASFSAGYDTKGLEDFFASVVAGHADPSLLADGFYIDDSSHVDLSGNVSLGAGLTALVFSVDVGGDVSGSLHVAVHDVNQATDGGRLRVNQIDPNWLYDSAGSLDAGVHVTVKIGVKVPFVGFVGVQHTFGPYGGNIFSFSSSKIPLYEPDPVNPILASRAADGTLTLLMGPNISFNGAVRNIGVSTDGNENFEVAHISGGAGAETLRVTFHDQRADGTIHDVSQTIANVARIAANGGAGDNVITVDPGVLASANLTGGTGAGNNIVNYRGSGSATLTGGDGRDTLTGGDGGATFYGGAGSDLMTGGAGNDLFNCTVGNDTIYGNAGNDTIYGGQGNDLIDAGRGINQIVVGSGVNTVTVHTGDGNQTITGGPSNSNTLNTLAVVGESGLNTMVAGAGTGANASAVVVQTGTGSIVATGMQNLVMDGAGGSAAITVNSMAGSGVQSVGVGLGQLTSLAGDGQGDSVTINGEPNDNLGIAEFTDASPPTLNGASNPAIGQLQPAIEITGMSATVVTANPLGQTLTVNVGSGNHNVAVNDPALLGALIVNGSAGANQIAIQAARGPTTINANSANTIVNILGNTGGIVVNVPVAGDVVNVGDSSGPGTTGIVGPVNVQGGASTNTTLNVNDSVESTGRTGTVTATTVTGLGMGIGVIYSGIKNLNVLLGTGSDNLSVTSVAPGTLTHVDGNAGNDWINASTSNGPVWVTDGNGANTIGGSNFNDTITSGNGPNVINGNDGADLITVGGGNNSINAGAGNDTVSAGGGTNYIVGGTGNDSITAGDGPNIIYGNDGNDVIIVGGGKNWISTGAGNDAVTAGDGSNFILGGAGNDSVVVGNGPDIIYGGSGNNVFTMGTGNDTVDAGSGNSTVTGGGGDNLLVQNANTNQTLTNNTLTGYGTTTFTGFQRVALTGGPGNINFDVSGWTGGPVAITGGGGNDTVSSSNNFDFTLADGSLRRGDGTVFSLSGISNAALTGGAGDNTFDVSRWTGSATLTGAGGDDGVVSVADGDATITDTLLARTGRGPITLSGITRADLTGGPGNNTLDASGFSHGATLNGGAGNDVLIGSNFDDSLYGGSGNDSIVTNGGNDLVNATGGSGDTINLGSGFDTVYGSSGADVINGATATDLIYEHPATTPLLPSPDPLANETIPGATLPTGPDTRGQWVEFSSSASGGGVSNSLGSAVDTTVAAGAAGQFVAWADNRSGTYQIYVAEHTTSGWQELAGSAHGGGISNSAGAARHPNITLDASGNPIVSWVNTIGGSSQILAARFVSGSNSWVAMGSAIATGAVDRPRIVNTAGGPVVAWLSTSGGITDVLAASFNGTIWSAAANVSQSASSVSDLSLSTDGANVAAVWTQPINGGTRIYLMQLSGGVWSAVGGSAGNDGISGQASPADQPTVAYHAGQLYVAWQSLGLYGAAPTISAATYTGGAWNPVGIDTPLEAFHVATRGAAGAPQLAEAGGNLNLVWLDDRQPDAPGQAVAIYANRLLGSTFVRQLPGDASFAGIQPGSAGVSGVTLAVDPAGHPFVSWGDSSSGSPQIYFRGDTLDIHNTYYVNNALSPWDSFTTAAGSTGNDGLSPATPKDSVQSVLNSYTLQSGDVVLVDSGTTAAFAATSVGSAYLVLGSTGVRSILSGTTSLTSTQGVTLANLALGNVNLTSATNTSLSNDISSNVIIGAGSGVQVAHGSATGVSLGGAIGSADVEWGSFGAVTVAGGSNLLVRGNQLSTLSITGTAAGAITGNKLSSGGTIVTIAAPFTGSIDHNFIRGGSVGVALSAAAPLVANSIFSNTTGVTDSAAGLSGLGFAAGSASNEIYANTTGVNLTGAMQLQHVWSNITGVTGSGTLGGGTLDTANLIERNGTGVNFTGTIQFNQIARNGIGIQATSGQLVAHNLIFRNLNAGIETSGASDVRIINNTFYATSGSNIMVDGGSSNVQVLNNILWTTAGYDLNVSDNSRSSFFSDYNDLFTTGTGKLVHWLLDFLDILDWQVTLNRLDLHSIGTTVVNPTFAMPRLVGPAGNDFRVQDPQTPQRLASPTIGTGVPWIDQSVPSTYTNLLANPSFESVVTPWTVNSNGATQTSNPAPFDGTSYFYSGGVAAGFAQQTISLIGAGFTAAQLDGQGLVAVFGGRVRSAAETPADQGQIVFTFLNGSGTTIGTPDTVPASNASDRWELIGDRLHIPTGARSVTYRFQSLRQTGTTDDSYLDNAFVYVLPSTTAVDMGAYGNTVSHPGQQSANIHLGYPDHYLDWELSASHNIQWSTFGSAGSPVNIDVYQDSPSLPQFPMRIASNVPDTGQFTWIPQNSGLTYGTYGLRIQISLASNPSVYDRSTESFTIPENGHSYYVNDTSQAGDVYTTAVGSNRNDGKLPGKPKPLLTSLLRIYNLGALDTVYVDTGTYNHLDPVVFSGNPLVGKNQGVTITGPANPANVAQITPLGFTSPAVFDINNANYVNLSHLTLGGGDYGLWVRNLSSNFTGTYLTLTGNSLDGIRLESDSSTNDVLDHIVSANNGRDGISIGGQGVNLTNSNAHNNVNYGIRYDNSGPVAVTGNQSYLNKYGIQISNAYGNAAATVGNTDLTRNLGNIVHDNTTYGINASGTIVVAGNTVSATGTSPGTGTVGINLQAGASATENVVFNNYRGIYSNSGSAGITNNRVFNTSGTAIYAAGSTPASGNVIYSNVVGLEGDGSPTWSNNLIYANSAAGIWLHSGVLANILNNTIYQTAGDGIRVDGTGASNQRINLRNNIVWTQNGYDLTVTPQAEIGFQSDYNDFYVTGSGQVGLWESAGRPTLQAWRLAGYTDFNSISAAPLFVNPAGADGQLGYTNNADYGSDDDFHEQSIAGSFHGGSLAPVISGTTGLPTLPVPTLTPDAANSPALDRGDSASSFTNEPAPNGGFINLGTYGNTTQASESTIPYVLVLSPNGGETVIEGETFTVTWRGEVTTGTANIDLMNGNSVVQNIATGVPNSGSYVWSVPASITPGGYTIRVSRTTPSPSSGISLSSFNIVSPVHTFYVNDGTFQAGDFTTAAGDDGINSGLDPAHPKASIRAILQAYNLLSGDVIDVDAGSYTLSNNIVIPAARSGIIIRGFYDSNNPTHVAVINRNSTTAGTYVFDLQGATNVTLDHLTLVGGEMGVNLADNIGSTGFTLSNSEIYGSATNGVYVGAANNSATITGNRVHDIANGYRPTGINTYKTQATISNNVVYNNTSYNIYVSTGNNSTISGNTAYNSGTGIYADTSTVSGNIAYNDGNAGIVAGSGSVVTGNTTYGQNNGNYYPRAGILVYGGTVSGNISYGNFYGIFMSGSGTITGNLLYNNTTAGATIGALSTFNANVLYGNGWGLMIGSASNSSQGPSVSNNLIYGNTTGGIQLNGGSNTPITNNTVYQTTGDALDVNPYGGGINSVGVNIRNNIFWVSSGYDLRIDPSSQPGVTADYNDLYVTGTGKIGYWQNTDYTTLNTWQLASLFDANSISADPLFVNPAAGDFHEQSLIGSFHGGSLAPVLNVATGLPVTATATLTPDAAQSPAIDRGDASFAYSNEPAPNGGYINLGTYGNTAQASESPTNSVLVTQPSGGQTWIEGQTYTITWRDASIGTGLVNIDLMTFSGGIATLQSNIVTGVANSGHYSWIPSGAIPPGGNYLIRVTLQGGASALSPAVFSLAAQVHTYYVNDGTVQAGDWTTAPGNDANSGLDPAHPKASINSVLANYNLGALDTIMIDAGTYTLASDVMLTSAYSGITLQGYNNPAYPTRQAILSRGNVSNSADIHTNGAANVTIENLTLTGAANGFTSTYGVASNNTTLANCIITGTSYYAVYLIGGADNFTLTNNVIHDNLGGVSTSYISNFTATGNVVYNNTSYAFGVSTNGGLISNNQVSHCGNVALGAYSSGAGGLVTVSNNIIHDNPSTTGLSISGNVLAIGNTVYNQTSTGFGGISVGGSSEARSNTVYNNYTGISVNGGLADLNRVYGNTNDGMYVGSGTATQNQVYSNGTGIEGGSSPTISNNTIYANTARGIYISYGVTPQIINNTVYQPAGDAIVLLSTEGNFQGQHMSVRDNILWAQAGYDLNLTDDAAIGFISDYNDLYVTGTGKVARISNRDYPALSDWIYEYGYDMHSISSNPQFVNITGPDGILGYSAGVDHGTDDNFHLQSTSPAIDAGDPTLIYFTEPAPNGGRINLGNFGGTAQADPTPAAQSVQITSPSNLQKLEAGHQYTLSWQTNGVTANQPVLLMNTGGPAVGYWTADAYTTTWNYSRTTTSTIDTSGVSNPAPQQVYQTYVYPGSGSEVAYQLPVADGNYTLRLHFMDEPYYIGKPVMNIKVNGVVVRSGFDLFATAGGYKATTLSFNVAASGGTGLLVEVVSVANSPVLSAIDLSAPNPTPVPSPTANLQVSTDSGNTWSTIATNQPLDVYGRGSFQWTPAVTTTGPTALFRVLINNTSLAGTSQPFAIYNGGTDYYVNDASQTGDTLTTAIGNNANSGKSPSAPLADIQAVLAQYNPGAGATIHVDAGTYSLVHNITLTAANSGLKIQGPANAAAVINRANAAVSVDNPFVFAAGANNITLDHLSITGGVSGIFADYGTAALNNIVSNNLIYGNTSYGVYIGGSNPGWLITGNTIHDNGSGGNYTFKGIDSESGSTTITNNKVFNESQVGILVNSGAGSTISGNETYANGTGIQSSGVLTISNNLVHDNSSYGIYATSALVTGNTVYRQTATSAVGIYLLYSEARSNTVYYNYNGIVAGNNSNNTIDRNDVYSNTNFGIWLNSGYGGIIENLVYANSAAGIVLNSSSGDQIANNTVYQLVGDALRFTVSPNATVRNNILWVEAGDDLDVTDTASQSGFVSDYNDLYRGLASSAHVGFWAGTVQDQLANWKTASSKDANSIASNPQFLNVRGADQVLGYSTAGSGYNGGVDDNFYLSAGSPAIDRGYTWAGYATDILNQPRADDPGTSNAGSNNFAPSDTGSSQFAVTGTATGWRTSPSSSSYWTYTFTGGFTFPFYGTTYTAVSVSVSGLLQFAGSDSPSDSNNSDAALLPDARIAAFWANLRTDQTGNNIYIDTGTSGQVKFTWVAANAATNAPVNFSVVLFSNGQIRFDYGAGNANLAPTVGVSMGDGQHATFLSYDNSANLANAHSMLLGFQPGFVDMGAYEFEGSSIDTTPPSITATIPTAVQSGGTATTVSQIGLTFSEPVNPIDAAAPSDYQLVGAGPDNQFGTADDVVYSLTPMYTIGSTQDTLKINAGPLPTGLYRLTVFGSPTGIHNLSGLLLDGVGNGVPGSNYVHTFSIMPALPTWLDPTSAATWDAGTHTLTVTGAAKLIADPGSDNPSIVDGNAGSIEINGGITVTNIGPITGTGSLIVDTGASLTAKSIAQTSLTVNGSLTMLDKAHGGNQIELGGIDASGNTTTAGVLTLGRDGNNNFTGKIDLADRLMMIHYTQSSAAPALADGPADYIDAALAQGRSVAPGGVFDGPWNGSGGIVSSTAAQQFASAHAATGSPNTEFYAVGYGDTGKMTLPDGTITDKMLIDDGGPSFFNPAANGGRGAGIGSTVFVRYTRVGDATMDGIVGNNDVTVLGLNFDPSYNPAVTGPRHWYDGNFNYNGIVDNNDVTILGLQFDPSNTTAVPAAAQTVTPSLSVATGAVANAVKQAAPASGTAGQMVAAVFSVAPITTKLNLGDPAPNIDSVLGSQLTGLFYDPLVKVLA